MRGSASLRLNYWGFNPSLWTFSFQHISKFCSFALPPQKPLHSVQRDKGGNTMISYKMFSRTCRNHRVGELHWFCNNDPNEQLSDEWCTCVGESAAQLACGTHLVTAYILRFPKCYLRKRMNGISLILGLGTETS